MNRGISALVEIHLYLCSGVATITGYLFIYLFIYLFTYLFIYLLFILDIQPKLFRRDKDSKFTDVGPRWRMSSLYHEAHEACTERLLDDISSIACYIESRWDSNSHRPSRYGYVIFTFIQHTHTTTTY